MTSCPARLWRVDLSAAADGASLCEELSPAERERADGLASASVKRRFVIARGTLRRLLGSLLDEAPRSLPIEAGATGKPRLAGKRGLRFNLSHSGDLAIVCIASQSEVGVDLESIRPVASAAAIARRRFSTAEANFVEHGEPSEVDRRFLLCWTRKEALGKALGTGITFDLLRLAVPLAPPGGIVSIDVPEGSVERWLLADIPLGTGHLATLALPAAAVRHSASTSSKLPQGPVPELDRCEEIDVGALVSRVASASPD